MEVFLFNDFPYTEKICIASGDFYFEELLNHRGAGPYKDFYIIG